MLMNMPTFSPVHGKFLVVICHVKLSYSIATDHCVILVRHSIVNSSEVIWAAQSLGKSNWIINLVLDRSNRFSFHLLLTRSHGHTIDVHNNSVIKVAHLLLRNKKQEIEGKANVHYSIHTRYFFFIYVPSSCSSLESRP